MLKRLDIDLKVYHRTRLNHKLENPTACELVPHLNLPIHPHLHAKISIRLLIIIIIHTRSLLGPPDHIRQQVIDRIKIMNIGRKKMILKTKIIYKHQSTTL